MAAAVHDVRNRPPHTRIVKTVKEPKTTKTSNARMTATIRDRTTGKHMESTRLLHTDSPARKGMKWRSKRGKACAATDATEHPNIIRRKFDGSAAVVVKNPASIERHKKTWCIKRMDGPTAVMVGCQAAVLCRKAPCRTSSFLRTTAPPKTSTTKKEPLTCRLHLSPALATARKTTTEDGTLRNATDRILLAGAFSVFEPCQGRHPQLEQLGLLLHVVIVSPDRRSSLRTGRVVLQSNS